MQSGVSPTVYVRLPGRNRARYWNRSGTPSESCGAGAKPPASALLTSNGP